MQFLSQLDLKEKELYFLVIISRKKLEVFLFIEVNVPSLSFTS